MSFVGLGSRQSELGAFELGSGPSSFNAGLSDTAVATDALTRQFIGSRSQSDTAVSTDALTTAHSAPRSPADTAAATDALSRSFIGTRIPTDTAAAVDSVTRLRTVLKSTSDSASALDPDLYPGGGTLPGSGTSPSGGVARVFVGTRVPTEATSISDVATRRITLAQVIADTAAATDAASRVWIKNILMTDSAPASDGAGYNSGIYHRIVTDNAPAVDAVAVQRFSGIFNASTADNAFANDGVTRTVIGLRSFAENAIAADVGAATNVGWVGNGFETITTSEALTTRYWVGPRGAIDNAPTTENLVTGYVYQRGGADNAASSDATDRQFVGIRLPSDIIAATDGYSGPQSLGRGAVEFAFANDFVVIHFFRPTLYIVGTADGALADDTSKLIRIAGFGTPGLALWIEVDVQTMYAKDEVAQVNMGLQISDSRVRVALPTPTN